MPRSFSIELHRETQVPAIWACLGVDPLDMPRTPYRASTIICTSFISSIDYNVFIVLQCHLKDHLYRKVT